jgi:hypothetical protein
MGIFSDTLEDNNEIHDYWSAFHLGAAPSGIRPSIRPPDPVLLCQTCGRLFVGRKTLLAHVESSHRGDRFYLRLDERVLGQLTFTDDVGTLTVVPLGDLPVAVEVEADGITPIAGIAVPGDRWTTQLRPSWPAESGLVRVMGRCGSAVREYRIYVNARPAFDSRLLDGAVVASQVVLSDPGMQDLSRLRPVANAQDALAQTYLDAFFEYNISVVLERDGDWANAARATESAWTKLGGFNTHLARSARSIVAFQMGAFGYLADPRTRSALGPVAGFLMSPPVRVRAEGMRGDTGIWIEPYLESLFDAIEAAALGRLDEARAILRGIGSSIPRSALVQRVTTLLHARIAFALGDEQGSRGWYQLLRADPDYGQEAEEHLT